MLRQSPRLKMPVVRIFPHVVDTILLASAIVMAYLSAQYPFEQGWLTAKLFGLLAYIGCGTMALKRGKTRQARVAFLALAILSYAYIVSVALTRSPYLL